MATGVILTVNANMAPATRTINAALNKNWNLGSINTSGFTQPLGRITGQSSEFAKSLEAANARVIAFGAAAGAIALVKISFDKLISSTIEVEQSLANINSILGLGEKSLSDFSGELFAAANKTGTSFKDAAIAATEFSRQGLSATETIKRTTAALTLARLSGMGFESAVTDVTAALNSFTKEALTAEDIINRMAAVDARFAVSSADLAEGIKRVGAAASDANVSFNQMLALITSAQQATARGGAVIGNSFKTIFTRAGRPEVLSHLEQIGIKTRNSAGEIRPLVEILKDLSDKYDRLGPSAKSATAELLGGVFQINILKTVLKDLGQGVSIYDGALKAANETTDESSRRLEKLNSTIAGKLQQTFNNFTETASNIGNLTLSPVIKGGLDFGQFAMKDVLSNVKGEEPGAQIAAAILSGIGKVLTGPGVQILTFSLAKLFGRLLSFASESAKDFYNINSEARELQTIQKVTNEYLSKHPAILQEVLNGTRSIDSVQKEVTKDIREQNILLQQQTALVSTLSKSLQVAGVRTTPVKTFANGYSPNFNVVQKEEMQARALGAPAGVRAHLSKGTIGGQRFVMNNYETEIPKFGTNGDSAVIPHYAKGHVPNFANFLLDRDFLEQKLGRTRAGKVFQSISDTASSLNLIDEIIVGAAGIGKTTLAKEKRPGIKEILSADELSSGDSVTITRAYSAPTRERNREAYDSAKSITYIKAEDETVRRMRRIRAQKESETDKYAGKHAYGRKGETDGPTNNRGFESLLGNLYGDKLNVLFRDKNFNLSESSAVEAEHLKDVAIIRGAFSPFTVGHSRLVEAALREKKNPIISVSKGINRKYDLGLTVDEKIAMISKLYPKIPVFPSDDFRGEGPFFKFNGSRKTFDPRESSPVLGEDRFTGDGSLVKKIRGEGFQDKNFIVDKVRETSGTEVREAVVNNDLSYLRANLHPIIYESIVPMIPELQRRAGILKLEKEEKEKQKTEHIGVPSETRSSSGTKNKPADYSHIAVQPFNLEKARALAFRSKTLRGKERKDPNLAASMTESDFSALLHFEKNTPAFREIIRNQGVSPEELANAGFHLPLNEEQRKAKNKKEAKEQYEESRKDRPVYNWSIYKNNTSAKEQGRVGWWMANPEKGSATSRALNIFETSGAYKYINPEERIFTDIETVIENVKDENGRNLIGTPFEKHVSANRERIFGQKESKTYRTAKEVGLFGAFNATGDNNNAAVDAVLSDRMVEIKGGDVTEEEVKDKMARAVLENWNINFGGFHGAGESGSNKWTPKPDDEIHLNGTLVRNIVVGETSESNRKLVAQAAASVSGPVVKKEKVKRLGLLERLGKTYQQHGTVPNFLDVSILKGYRAARKKLESGDYSIRDLSTYSPDKSKKSETQGAFFPATGEIAMDENFASSATIGKKSRTLGHEGVHYVIDRASYHKENSGGLPYQVGLRRASAQFHKQSPASDKKGIYSYNRTEAAGYDRKQFLEEALADGTLDMPNQAGKIAPYLKMNPKKVATLNKMYLGLRAAANKSLVENMAGGYVPNFVPFKLKKDDYVDEEYDEKKQGKPRKMTIPSTGSKIDYTPKKSRGKYTALELDYILSERKGDGFKLFSNLAKLAKKTKLPIISNSLISQMSQETASGLTDSNWDSLVMRFPQLKYRQQEGLTTSGNYVNEATDEEFSFKNLYRLQEFVNKTDKDRFAQSRPVILDLKTISKAAGHIPNFDSGAAAAVGREHAAGIPMHAIRIDSHPSLVTPGNPSGLGVWNTVQETGLFDGMNKSRQAGISPKTKGAAKGHVPNFSDEGNQFGMSVGLGTLQFVMSALNVFGKELAKSNEKIAGFNTSLTSSRNKIAEVRERAANIGADDPHKMEATLVSARITPGTTRADQVAQLQKKRDSLLSIAKSRTLNPNQEAIRRSVNESLLSYARDSRVEAREERNSKKILADISAQEKLQPDIRGRQEKKEKQQMRAMQISAGASFVAGAVPQGTTTGKAIGAGAEAIGVGAQIASVIPGHAGIAAGAIVGLGMAAFNIGHILNDKAPKMQEALDAFNEKAQKSSASLTEYSQALGSLNSAYEDSTVSSQTVSKLQKKLSESLLHLSDENRRKINAAATTEQKQRVINEIQENDKKHSSAAENEIEFQKRLDKPTWFRSSTAFNNYSGTSKADIEKDKQASESFHFSVFSNLGKAGQEKLSDIRENSPLIEHKNSEVKYKNSWGLGFFGVGTQEVIPGQKGNSKEILGKMLRENVIDQERYNQLIKAGTKEQEKFIEGQYKKSENSEKQIAAEKVTALFREKNLLVMKGVKDELNLAESRKNIAILKVDHSVKDYVSDLLEAAKFADKLQFSKNANNLQIGKDAVEMSGMLYGAGTKQRLSMDYRKQEVTTKFGEEKTSLKTTAAENISKGIMNNILAKSDSVFKDEKGKDITNEAGTRAKIKVGQLVGNSILSGSKNDPKGIYDNIKNQVSGMKAGTAEEKSLKLELQKGLEDKALYSLIHEQTETMNHGIDAAAADADASLSLLAQINKGEIAILDENRKSKQFGTLPTTRQEEHQAERQLKKDKRGFDKGNPFATVRYAKQMTEMFGDSLSQETIGELQYGVAKSSARDRQRKFGIISSGNSSLSRNLRGSVGKNSSSVLLDSDYARARTIIKGEDKNATLQKVGKDAGIGDMSELISANKTLSASMESLGEIIKKLNDSKAPQLNDTNSKDIEIKVKALAAQAEAAKASNDALTASNTALIKSLEKLPEDIQIKISSSKDSDTMVKLLEQMLKAQLNGNDNDGESIVALRRMLEALRTGQGAPPRS